MQTMYTISNVPNLGPYDKTWNSMDAAEAYMESRGYIYVCSASCDHPSEEARYYLHRDHAEEQGVDLSTLEDWDLTGDHLDKVYGLGYEPVITPVIDED